MNKHLLTWIIEEIWNFSKVNDYLFNHIKSNIYFIEKINKLNDIKSKYLQLRKK